jgi:hypothetical protein
MNKEKRTEEKFETKLFKFLFEMKYLLFLMIPFPLVVVYLYSGAITIQKNDPKHWFGIGFIIILYVFIVLLFYMHNKLSLFLKNHSDTIINKWIEAFTNILSKEKKNSEDEIIKISDNIFKQRALLWEKAHSGDEENNLLRSLVYPASSLYSVTAFIIGKDQKDNPTHMLFMIPKNENNNNKIYEVLGQRMPVNSLPHCFVKSLVKKYVDDDYQNDEIEFSKKFHEKEETVDDFTKTVPLPYRIQEECNIQFGGNPFHLDHIYVLEIQIKGLLGLQQADLVAIWIDFEKVKQICKNVLNPKVYGETSVDSRGKEYIKFESQRKLAVDIIDKYLSPKK